VTSKTIAHEGEIVQCVFLSIIASILTVIHFFLSPSFLSVLLSITGSIIYLSFLQVNSLDLYRRFDYIQSGEGPLFAAIIIIALFFNFSPVVIFIAVLVSSILLNLIQKFFIEEKAGEIFYSGIFITFISIILITFIYFKNNTIQFESLLYGYFSLIELLYLSLFIIITGIALMFFFPRIRPLFQLYTHGRDFFQISGLNYNAASFVITLLRSIFLTTAVFSTGFYNGIGNYIYKRSSILSEINTLLIILSYSQALFLIVIYTKSPIIIGVSIMISYIVYFIIGKKSYYSF